MTFLVAVAAVALAAVSARGQGHGDYDGDGDVDGDDFWYWAGCMTGPAGGPLGPGCEAFDFDPFLAPDAKVDLADFTAFGQVFNGSGLKVPLGGGLASTTEGGLFKVYVPTKWGGVLTVATSAGSIGELKYPDGSPFQNGTETGENRHGWYTFVVIGSTNYTVSATFVQSGTAARRPWNFYWWAKKGDYIREPLSGGNGVANTTAAGTDRQMISVGQPAQPGADIVRCHTDGTLETTPAPDDERRSLWNLFDRVDPYRPLDKYDQLHGGWPRQWEAEADAETPEEWWGHCLGGSMASILLNQPTPAPGKPYNQDEIEGLWAELGENGAPGAYQYSPGHWLAQGQIPAGPPAPGYDPTDSRIGWLHARFEECIRHERVALQSNLRGMVDPDHVWNHAVYQFTATYSEAPGGNERIVHIVNDLKANKDYPPPTNDPDDREFTYTYDVVYSAGTVRENAGDFVSVTGEASFAPAWMDHVLSGIWVADNPWVLETDVRADDGSN